MSQLMSLPIEILSMIVFDRETFNPAVVATTPEVLSAFLDTDVLKRLTLRLEDKTPIRY